MFYKTQYGLTMTGNDYIKFIILTDFDYRLWQAHELDISKNCPYLGCTTSGATSPDQKHGVDVAERADIVHRPSRHYKETYCQLGRVEGVLRCCTFG